MASPILATSNLKVHVLRLTPGQELKTEVQKIAEKLGLRAAFVMTCVGSVTKATLRYANGTNGTNEIATLTERMEILSLVGTVSGGEGHLHVTLGRADGSTIGGHVMGDMEIFTTAEIVLGEAISTVFAREMDETTGFPELILEERKPTLGQ